MTDWLRRAGRGRTDDGAQILWSVAEGERGRRWRAAAIDGERLASSLLLEVGLDGRPARLELTTRFGLLTVHPERGEAELHGNVVGADGVRPIALPWSDRHAIDVARQPIPLCVELHALAGRLTVGEERRLSVLAVGLDLSVVIDVRTVRRLAEWRWRVTGGAGWSDLELDERGIPALSGAAEWPLEE